ncbi:MAG TPA: hypothetical protein VHL10_06435 [Nitrososphaera sp.]|nr:hypothetical protein [Nitrososphaera sp.]
MSAAGNIIQILANLPDFLRKPMLQNRLKEFYAMSDGDRQETISMALSAAPTIEPAKLAVLFRTWLEILSEFDSEKRAIMFQTYCGQILASPRSVEKLDFKSLTATFLSLDQRQRDRIADSLHEVLFSFPNRNEILKLVPEDSLRAVGLK